MGGGSRENRNKFHNNAELPDVPEIRIPGLDTIGETPGVFVRTSLMVDSSKYTLIKLLAAFRMEEIRQCLDEAILHFIDENKNEIRKAIEWHKGNETRKKKRG